MSFKGLVIDETVLGTLDAALIEDGWFEHFNLPERHAGLKRVESGNLVYLLSEELPQGAAGLLVVDLMAMKLLRGKQNLRYRFERVIRVALRHFSREVSIPLKWQMFHQGSLVSVYGDTLAKSSGLRLYFDQAPCGDRNIFAYGTSIGATKDFASVLRNDELYQLAIGGYEAAALTESSPEIETGHFGIVLGQTLGAQFSGSATLEEWYENRLTRDQRRFVDSSHSKPVRLRGAAGTGKTQAVAIKALRDLYAAETRGEDFRIAIIAHSSALVHDVIRGMFYALDPAAKWEALKSARLWTGTLYEFAQEVLQYERKGLQPLSLDGKEGRTIQRLLLEDALNEVAKNARLSLSLLKRCSPELQRRIGSPEHRDVLISEIAIEFGCVIEAENIRKGTKEAERYLSGQRESWQMILRSREDRLLMLELYHLYESDLASQKMLSMDQMIADFSRYFSTHEWRQLREQLGFDVVFVDEFHYFNRIEVMTFHHLFRSKAISSGSAPLFMAYDLKQSPNDVALNTGGKSGSHYFKMAASGKTELVEFKTIFRSTPQIVGFLRDLDSSFPAIGLEDEWQTYNGASALDAGDTPLLLTYPTNQELLDATLRAAGEDVKNCREGGRQVAILCLNDSLFEIYTASGRVDGKVVALTSRDQMDDLRYAKSRCVLSMPQYVAGLQFDIVYLIHADKAELAEAEYSAGLHRRVVSRFYLGASRAAKKLIIMASEERGGASEVLDCPLRQGSLLT